MTPRDQEGWDSEDSKLPGTVVDRPHDMPLAFDRQTSRYSSQAHAPGSRLNQSNEVLAIRANADACARVPDDTEGGLLQDRATEHRWSGEGHSESGRIRLWLDEYHEPMCHKTVHRHPLTRREAPASLSVLSHCGSVHGSAVAEVVNSATGANLWAVKAVRYLRFLEAGAHLLASATSLPRTSEGNGVVH